MSPLRKLRRLVSCDHASSEILSNSREAVWAHVYQDSIRDRPFLRDLSLNVGRWAGNYSFFYLLNRILMDCRPRKILEMGLGESTKFISTYLDNELFESQHLVIEHDHTWVDIFRKGFHLSERSEIIQLPLSTLTVHGNVTTVYQNLAESNLGKFDFYVIDGPIGSKRFSRFDLVGQLELLNGDDQFIMLIDDYERLGEKDTVEQGLTVLKNANVPVATRTYKGKNSQLVIASPKYKWATSF